MHYYKPRFVLARSPSAVSNARGLAPRKGPRTQPGRQRRGPIKYLDGHVDSAWCSLDAVTSVRAPVAQWIRAPPS